MLGHQSRLETQKSLFLITINDWRDFARQHTVGESPKSYPCLMKYNELFFPKHELRYMFFYISDATELQNEMELHNS